MQALHALLWSEQRHRFRPLTSHIIEIFTYQVTNIVHIRTWCAPGTTRLVGYFWLDKNIIWWQNDTKQLPWMAEMENIQRGVLVSFLLGWLGTIPAWVGLLFIVISTTINFCMFHLFVALFGLQIKRLPRWFKTPSHRCVNFLLLVPTVQHSLDGTRWC